MAFPKLSREKMEQAAKAYVAAGGHIRNAAKSIGVNPNTFQHRIDRAREQIPEMCEISAEELREPTIEEHVQEQRNVAEARALRAKLRDAARLIADLEDRIKDLSWVAEASYTPAKWTTPARKVQQSEHTPVLFTSDFHCGEVAKAEETEAGYGYNSSVFSSRYRHMVDTAILLSFEHVGAEWKFPGIIYERGGDAISGQLHPELIETDDLAPLEAVKLVAEEEMGGIKSLADAFGRVEVKSFAGGNHDRDLLKPTTKGAAAHSYDVLIEYMLRREFRNDKRVTFQTSRSFDVRFPIYDRNILLTHGDRMGSRGGQGFIGPAATILRGVQKVRQEQAALGYHIDQVHCGHFHFPFYAPEVISNGSMPGYTEFAKQFRMRPNPPQQALTFWHPRRGLVDYKPIILTDA